MVKNWCSEGSSLVDLVRNKPDLFNAYWLPVPRYVGEDRLRKELNQLCEENRRKWMERTEKVDLKRFKGRQWKLCPNYILRLTRPRKVAHMCCTEHKTQCMDPKMFGLTDGITRLKRQKCRKDNKPTCEEGARPQCTRTSRGKGSTYEWECPENKMVSGRAAKSNDDWNPFAGRCQNGGFVNKMQVWEKDNRVIKAFKYYCSDGTSSMNDFTFGTKNKPGAGKWARADIINDAGFGSINVSANDDVVQGIGAYGHNGKEDGNKRWIQWGNMDASRRIGCPADKKIIGFDVGEEGNGTAISKIRVICG